MRRRLVLMATTLLILGLVARARAGEGDNDEAAAVAPKPSWFQRLFPFTKRKAPPPPAPAKSRLPTRMESAALQAREMDNWLRRSAVCDKLRYIAKETDDQELLRKADQLDQRAYAIYCAHAGRLPGGDSAVQLDERILERRLGRTAPAGQGLLPAQRASGSQASLGED